MEEMIKIRRAERKDVDRIMGLLRQVNDIHADGRPDLFRHGCTKYTPEELAEIIRDPFTPIFVAVDASDRVAGYCFCVVQDYSGSNNQQPVKTLYIDDLCVDENCRGGHIGSKLYENVKAYAQAERFYNITLNVWSCNPTARRFYESHGMTPLKTGMEQIL